MKLHGYTITKRGTLHGSVRCVVCGGKADGSNLVKLDSRHLPVHVLCRQPVTGRPVCRRCLRVFDGRLPTRVLPQGFAWVLARVAGSGSQWHFARLEEMWRPDDISSTCNALDELEGVAYSELERRPLSDAHHDESGRYVVPQKEQTNGR